MEIVAPFLRVGIQSLEVKGPDDFGVHFKPQPKSVLTRLWWKAARFSALTKNGS